MVCKRLSHSTSRARMASSVLGSSLDSCARTGTTAARANVEPTRSLARPGSMSASTPDNRGAAVRLGNETSSGSALGETDFRGHGAQSRNDEGDVGVEIHAELLGAAVDVVAVHGPGEALVLELLAHRGRLKAGDDLARPHERTGVH